MAHGPLKVSMNVKVYFEYLFLFALVFHIPLVLGSTAKGGLGPGLLGIYLEILKFGFSCLVGSGVFDKTITWIPTYLRSFNRVASCR